MGLLEPLNTQGYGSVLRKSLCKFCPILSPVGWLATAPGTCYCHCLGPSCELASYRHGGGGLHDGASAGAVSWSYVFTVHIFKTQAFLDAWESFTSTKPLSKNGGRLQTLPRGEFCNRPGCLSWWLWYGRYHIFLWLGHIPLNQVSNPRIIFTARDGRFLDSLDVAPVLWE